MDHRRNYHAYLAKYNSYAELETRPYGLTRAAYFSIAWLLLNWCVHDSLHTHVGMDLYGFLGIEYGSHITLMIE
jgi:hypothetical protein